MPNAGIKCTFNKDMEKMNERNASMRGIGDFASGDQRPQLDWTAPGPEGKHEAISGNAEHCTINLNF